MLKVGWEQRTAEQGFQHIITTTLFLQGKLSTKMQLEDLMRHQELNLPQPLQGMFNYTFFLSCHS